MMFESTSIISVVGAAVSSIIIGFVWYGPLFGRQWAALQGWSEEDMQNKKAQGMNMPYALMSAASLLGAYVLAVFAKTTGSVTLTDGASLGFFVWLGFAVPLLLSSVLWEGKPAKLYALNLGYNLVTYVIMGAVVSLWG